MRGVHKPIMLDDVGRGYTKQELAEHIEEARKSLGGRAAGPHVPPGPTRTPPNAAMLALVLGAVTALLIALGLAAGAEGLSFAWRDDAALLARLQHRYGTPRFLDGSVAVFEFPRTIRGT